MKDVGVDFVIISWWGNNGYEDNATLRFIDANIEENLPLKFCIIIEPYTGSINYTFVYYYIYDHYASPYSSIYVKWRGYP